MWFAVSLVLAVAKPSAWCVSLYSGISCTERLWNGDGLGLACLGFLAVQQQGRVSVSACAGEEPGALVEKENTVPVKLLLLSVV